MNRQRQEIGILLIEDSPGDTMLFEELLAVARGEYRLSCVDTLEAGLALLAREGFDIVVLDLGLPDSQGLESFLRTHARVPEMPIIVLTGYDDETASRRAVHEGAQDYLVKGTFDSDALARAIRYAIERQHLLVRLEKSMKEIRVLKGFLPICASCKKIRDEGGDWQQMESYIRDHSEAEFSHGLCPACAANAYEELRRFKGASG